MCHNGFWNELIDIRKSIDPCADFSFLENEMTLMDGFKRYTVYDFLHGSCVYFAQYLHDMYGYEMEHILDDDGKLCHAYCKKQADNGKTLFIDVRGAIDDFNMFMEEFEDFVTPGEWDQEEWKAHVKQGNYSVKEELLEGYEKLPKLIDVKFQYCDKLERIAA